MRLNFSRESESGVCLRHPALVISRGAFTLIELILVMTILTIAVSITAPALANFFHGRTLDSEVRRLLALTRQGQSRAVSGGLPVELWFDTAHGTLGLEAEPSYEADDPKAVKLEMDSDIQLQVVTDNTANSAGSSGVVSTSGAASVAPVTSRHPELPKIRFLPDGSMDESSPKKLVLTGRDGMSICLQQSRNGLSYEIRARSN